MTCCCCLRVSFSLCPEESHTIQHQQGSSPPSSSTRNSFNSFKNLSQWWHTDLIEIKPSSSEAKQKISQEEKSLRIQGSDSLCWVQEELRRLDHQKEDDKAILLTCAENYKDSQGDINGAVALVNSLKVCAKQKALQKGRKLHAIIVRRGLLEQNVFIGNTLVNMYAKCGALEEAQDVFYKLPNRSIVSWNAIIAGCAHHGHARQALGYFQDMKDEGITPNSVTFLCILKACAGAGMANKCQDLHDQIVKENLLETHVEVGNALVDMYAKCGFLEKAQETFDTLPVRNIVSWNVLLGGYVQHGYGEKALDLFELMQGVGFPPDEITFVCALKASGSVRAANIGRDLHAMIVRERLLGTNLVVSNALIDMYAKCGVLDEAQEVLNKIPVRDIVSWTALLGGYAQHEYGEEALNCFEEMQRDGFSPDAITFASVFKACGCIQATNRGLELHAEIVGDGWSENDIVISTALVDMYAKCGLFVEARDMFDELSAQDVVAWNALIGGYVQREAMEEAFSSFEHMRCAGFLPDAFTFACILRACGSMREATKGQESHAEIMQRGLFEEDMVVGTALVDMYAKCGLLQEALKVFDKLPVLNVVSWNALISGLVEHDHGEQAVKCFERMRSVGFSPDEATFACLLKACGGFGSPSKGQEIHADILIYDLLEDDMMVGTALVDMYAKHGLLEEAQGMFDELLVRSVASWNALMGGYARQDDGEKTLECFERMQREGFLPDAVTFSCVLKVCGSLGASDKGQKVHAEIMRKGLLEEHSLVGTALVVMYAQCGMLAEAQEVLDKMSVPDVVSWNGLMTGCAQLGRDSMVFGLASRMTEENSRTDLVTSIIVLTVCSHSGLLLKGKKYFEMVSTENPMLLCLEVNTCIVDLLGRAGHLEEAVAIIQEMPEPVDLTLLSSFLSTCQMWGYAMLGRCVSEYAIQMDEKESAATYVCLSNIYTG